MKPAVRIAEIAAAIFVRSGGRDVETSVDSITPESATVTATWDFPTGVTETYVYTFYFQHGVVGVFIRRPCESPDDETYSWGVPTDADEITVEFAWRSADDPTDENGDPNFHDIY